MHSSVSLQRVWKQVLSAPGLQALPWDWLLVWVWRGEWERRAETFRRKPAVSQLSLPLFRLIFFPSQEILNLVLSMEILCPLTNHLSFQIHFCVLSSSLHSLERQAIETEHPRDLLLLSVASSLP